MKKMRLLSVMLGSIMLLVTACQFTTNKAFTFTVDTGDNIKVSLDTTGDFDLSSNLPFAISHKGNVLSEGTFIYGEAYDDYVEVVGSDADAELLDSGSKDGNEYIFWCYNDTEYNYAILVGGSDTGIVLGNVVSEASAKECFERLTISVAE